MTQSLLDPSARRLHHKDCGAQRYGRCNCCWDLESGSSVAAIKVVAATRPAPPKRPPCVFCYWMMGIAGFTAVGTIVLLLIAKLLGVQS